MKWPRDLLLQLAAETEPDPRAVERMYSELCGSDVHPETASLLNELPSVDPHAASRVAARLATARPRQRWGPPALGLAAALAAAALLVLRPAAPPKPIEITLQATEWDRSSPIDGVQLAYQGTGQVNGLRRDLVVEWEIGTLHVDVEPHSDTTLVVTTPDGTVRVIGTVFTVVRDPLGTHVAVEHGRVEVTCTAGVGSVLAASEHHSCLPASAAGMLGRAVTMRDRGGDAKLVLDAAEAGLAAATPDSALRGELQQVRLQALLKLARPEQALLAADEYLLDPSAPRRIAVLRIAGGLAKKIHGCSAAIPYLERLVALQPTESDKQRLDRCRARLVPSPSQ